MDIVELADRLWRGEEPTQQGQPVGQVGHLAEITDGVAFMPNFGNCTCSPPTTARDGRHRLDHHRAARPRRDPLVESTSHCNAIFSHGHIDHVFGVGPFDEEATTNGWRLLT